MFKGLYDALPTREDLASRSTGLVNTTAARLRQAQEALTGTADTARRRSREVLRDSMVHTRRQLERQYPTFMPSFNDMAGYQEALLKSHNIHDLRDLVLHYKVDVHYNRWGYNALSCVATDSLNIADQKARIQFLLQCRVDVNSPSAMQHHRTPLHLLIADENEDVALFLILHTRKTGHAIALHLQDMAGNTPLLLALKTCQVKVVDAILREMEIHGANIGLNSRDSDGKSALDCAFSLGIEKIIIKLIALRAEPSAVGNHNALKIQPEEILKTHNFNVLRYFILVARLDVHYDLCGFNALCSEASIPTHSENQQACIEFLLQCGVDVNSPSAMQLHRTPLHLLIFNKNEKTGLFLIEQARQKKHWIAFAQQDAHGNTPLLLAVKTMQPKIVFAMLHEMKAFNTNIGLDLADSEGRTALDCAVILGQDDMVRALVRLEAKPNIVCNYFSNLSRFDDIVIQVLLQSVDIDPNQVCEKTPGYRRCLYAQCLRDQQKVKLIFSPCLYQGVLLIPVPDWQPIDLPPLYADQHRVPSPLKKFQP